ncbi:hypothetical protein ACWD6I_05220 [Streptomyces sp. NPDC002454]|uniref:hypothetical protein n=1 Tax=Streptomyces sp. NPDC002490 TaxID=3154416 RepID=UPI00333356A0
MTRSDSVLHPALLQRIGRLPWPQARTRLAGSTCAWADLDGFHLAPADALPVDPPCTTHLWAWRADLSFRLRIDGPRALVAALRCGPGEGDPVQVRIRSGTPWSRRDRQVGPLPPEAHALAFELLELSGPAPATFVRASP